MKHQRKLLGVLLLVVGLGGLLTWSVFTGDKGISSLVQASDAPPEEQGAKITTSDDSLTAVKAHEIETKQERYASLLSRLNHKRIDFYGQVVDESGKPIADVKVTGSTIYNTGYSSGVEEKVTTTDAQGYFQFQGMSGRTFDYHLEKLGYETWPEGDAFDYTELVPEAKRHKPDPKKPVVVKMYKLKGAVPLIYVRDCHFDMPADGKLLRVDLATGKEVASGGDLVFELWHSKSKTEWPIQDFEWKARMRAPDGGFAPTDARLRLFAPEDGYLKVREVSHSYKTNPNFPASDEGYYYVRTPKGQYAIVDIKIHADTSKYPSYVALSYYLNPEPGNRVLEYDQAKRVLLPGQNSWD